MDRDGVLNVDRGYSNNIKNLSLVKGITNLLLYLKKLDYKFFIITNQSGISKGLYTLEEMNNFNKHLVREFKKFGVEFQYIYYCPHHPEIEICSCRKPSSGLFQKAKKEFNVDIF